MLTCYILLTLLLISGVSAGISGYHEEFCNGLYFGDGTYFRLVSIPFWIARAGSLTVGLIFWAPEWSENPVRYVLLVPITMWLLNITFRYVGARWYMKRG